MRYLTSLTCALFFLVLSLAKPVAADQAVKDAKADKPASEVGDRMRLMAAIIPRDGAVWHFKLMGKDEYAKGHRDAFVKFVETLTFVSRKDENGREVVEPKWELPKGWEHRAGTGMRFATIIVGEEKQGVAITIFRFGAESGDVGPNVRRWAGQVGVEVKDDAQLKELARTIKVDGKEATLVDILGKPGSAGGGVIGVAPPRPPVKPEQVAAKAPEGWTKNEKPSQFVTLQYDYVKEGRSVTLTVSLAGGDIEANLNRWREQVGLKAWDENGATAAFEAGREIKPHQVGDRRALYVDFTGPEGDKRERILGALTANNTDRIWFFKLRGPADLVESQREAFDAWLKTVKFEAGE